MPKPWWSLSGLLVGTVLAGLQPGLVRADEVGPFGPPFGARASVVRSFSLKTTGAVIKEVTGKQGDEDTGLRGQCNPKRFANFSIDKGSMFTEQAEIAIVTITPIATGATGTIRLSKIYVRFFDDANGERKFGGPGTLTLTTHEAAAGKRRMVGTIAGSKLAGFAEQEGKTIDATASFDLNFSCGVK